ncbi:LacI family DNA-binding transcriptional regulator [Plantactinospora mayteni]|uniref:LacI family transcriptional regulator n=1 Tax=Plantactinospora mayteni TaxID=566021 RepID=A0ABQ4F0Z4_9ACTN|nr:LacI family DNA-binding transcriptional regulator [Plantactinospora mayteni]GIH00583.1 LacI family transcriptional regulator [Plantactinospora mayteni]
MTERVAASSGRSGRRKRPTMLDVAREAGVALRTVSRVVNEDPTVGAQLASRVQAAISALGYAPDERAQQLRRGTSGTVGAAVRNLADAHPVLSAVDNAAREAGLAVLAMSTEDDEQRERAAVMSMCRRRVDGIVIEPIGMSHDYLSTELAAGLPLVAVDRPTGGVEADAVLSDNAAGIGMAYRQLALHGHQRIGYIGDDERIFTGRERAAAFRACVAASGGPLDGMTHPGAVSPGRISAALAAVFSGPTPATALITGNAETTIEVLRHLGADAGRVALVGFDDFPLADILRPGLTVVAQNSAVIGRTAIDLLVARSADPARPVQTVTVPVELIARGSGELPPPD